MRFFLIFTFLLASCGSMPRSSTSRIDIFRTSAYAFALKHNKNHRDVITLVNFGMPNNSARLWVVNIRTHRVLFNTQVARGSGKGFSNRGKSHSSSLGVYITGEVYIGKHGYSLRLYGISRTNNNAYRREIVIHSANYVSRGHVGHSWGCLALSPHLTKPIIQAIKRGTEIYVYV